MFAMRRNDAMKLTHDKTSIDGPVFNLDFEFRSRTNRISLTVIIPSIAIVI